MYLGGNPDSIPKLLGTDPEEIPTLLEAIPTAFGTWSGSSRDHGL